MYIVICQGAAPEGYKANAAICASFAFFDTEAKAMSFAMEKTKETGRACRIARVIAEVEPSSVGTPSARAVNVTMTHN